MKSCLFFFFCYLFYSCLDFEDKQLEYALNFAGDNRNELEKVLEHYASDPEKLESARFLIRNMPRYYGYEGWRLDSIQKVLAVAEQEQFVTDSAISKWTKVSPYLLPKVYDAHVITADYLIENIDLSFKVWKGSLWNRNLSFDDFCELILPYRIGDEPLSRWRTNYFKKYISCLDSLKGCVNPLVVCNVLAKELSKKEFFYLTDFDMPRLSAKFLFNHRVGYCREMCDVAIYAMRACGIPVATDMFVCSPEYQGSHQWTVVRDSTGYFYPFWITWYEIAGNMKDDGRKKGKVYRECFGMQQEPISGITNYENLPVLFKNRFIKYVTDNYIDKNEFTINVDVENRYIYLGVFSSKGWIPIDMGRNSGGKVVFKNVEPNLIYQPLYSDGKAHLEAGLPFLYASGEVSYFRPDTQKKEKVALTRKMSLIKNIKAFLYRSIVGVEIEGSKNLSFDNPKELLTLKDTLSSNYNEFLTQDTSGIRYIRYNSAPDQFIELAEIAFFEDMTGQKEIPVKVVNKLKPLYPENSMDKLNDKDILSYFESADTTCHILFDLGKLVSVKKILICPRNDDNYVCPGDEYELFYNEGIKGWISLGKQIAEDRILYYEVPENALFWLRNLTKGKEEQVFFCRNGHPYFVTDIPEIKIDATEKYPYNMDVSQ